MKLKSYHYAAVCFGFSTLVASINFILVVLEVVDSRNAKYILFHALVATVAWFLYRRGKEIAKKLDTRQ